MQWEMYLTCSVLKIWKENPHKLKSKLYSGCYGYDHPENDRPLTSYEVDKLKMSLRKHGPKAFQSLFPWERN